jgi:hypothetical protein
VKRSEDPIPTGAALEVIATLLRRENEFQNPKLFEKIVKTIFYISTKSFKFRQCAKEVCFILQQAIVRDPRAVHQVIYGSGTDTDVVTECLARTLLDPKFEEEVKLENCEFVQNEKNSDNFLNFSKITKISLNQFSEISNFNKLLKLNENNFKIHPENPVTISRTRSVYQKTTARLMALFTLLTAPDDLAARLLGFVETSIGVLSNDLKEQLVAADALFCLVDSPPPGTVVSESNEIEFLFLLKNIYKLINSELNQKVVIQYILYRWPTRFSTIQSLMLAEPTELKALQLSELFNLFASELTISGSNPEHLKILEEFIEIFLINEISKGESGILEIITKYSKFQNFENLKKSIFNFLILIKNNKNEINCNLIENLFGTLKHHHELMNLLLPDFVPNLLLAVDQSKPNLSFSLRCIKHLIRLFDSIEFEPHSEETESGIVQSLAVCVYPFIEAESEIWMISKNSKLIEIFFNFSIKFKNYKILLILISITTISFNPIINELIIQLPVDRLRNCVGVPDQKMNEQDKFDFYFAELVHVVKDQVLHIELGI